MSLTERFEQIKNEGEKVVVVMDERVRLSKLLDDVSKTDEENNQKIRERLVESGLGEILSEALDLIDGIPELTTDQIWGAAVYGYNPHTNFYIGIRYDFEDVEQGGAKWRGVSLLLPLNDEDAISVSSFTYSNVLVEHGASIEKIDIWGETLTREQWQNRDRLEASIATAIFKAREGESKDE